jgi:phosphoserine phosphatase
VEPPEALAAALAGEGAAAFWERINGPPGLAAFDADGTLWEGDIGEDVLQALIRGRLLVDPHDDAWEEYARRVRRDPADGFAFAGRLMRGLDEATVREVSERVFAERFANAVFPVVRFCLEHLAARGWDVYVVSASNRWSVEIGAAKLGIAPERVIGLSVAVEGGRLTDRLVGPVPTLEGKPVLLRQIAGRDADVAFGNSVLDLPLLLTSATPVAVGSPYPGNRFLAQARKRGFAVLEIPFPR